MFMWPLIQFLIVLAVGILITVNIIIPPWVGKPFFFMFRRGERRLLKAKESYKDQLVERSAEAFEGFLSEQTTRSRDYQRKKTVAKPRKSSIITNITE